MNTLTQTEAQRLARTLMLTHGVGYMDFKWGRGKSRIAACHYWIENGKHLPYEIRFSAVFLPHLDRDRFIKVMLHEIAHAKAPGDQHGPKWAAECRKLGISPDRCENNLPSAPATAVTSECSVCGTDTGGQHRLPLRVYKHKGCGGVIKWFRHGKEVSLAAMPARYRAEYARSRFAD